ncbi:hypothetical protein B0F90DRAFT_1626107 [Multifurca ochricompacta]|uniref:Uncharacterized protein n=1 Tax=Multifurca ochricompacta TaxID=376703 RepID=A0AAD4QPW7_9AGAM|nr:hypothetical protein B0F90DRAFT_1626107 [Multifurca ochricompacta]
MSAVRTAIAKHTRTLSQPLLRRSFYSPFAALQHSPILAKPSSSSGSNNAVETAHEHEREHAQRTLHVVSEPNTADFKYGVPAGAYPNAAPYHPMTPTSNGVQVSAHENVSASSTQSSHIPSSHTRRPQNTAGVGASAAVRFHFAPRGDGAGW